jgi:hypothetical protein
LRWLCCNWKIEEVVRVEAFWQSWKIPVIFLCVGRPRAGARIKPFHKLESRHDASLAWFDLRMAGVWF